VGATNSNDTSSFCAVPLVRGDSIFVGPGDEADPTAVRGNRLPNRSGSSAVARGRSSIGKAGSD